jgi:hypothetical protein
MDLPNEKQQQRMANLNNGVVSRDDLKGVTEKDFKRANPQGNFKPIKKEIMTGVEVNKQKERVSKFWKQQNQLSKERRKSENSM